MINILIVIYGYKRRLYMSCIMYLMLIKVVNMPTRPVISANKKIIITKTMYPTHVFYVISASNVLLTGIDFC